jgi:hypothetical protein
MFSVKMNIHEDKELREYIQTLITKQVKSGVKKTIQAEVRALTIKAYGEGGFEDLVKSMVTAAIKKDTKLRKLMTDEITRHIKREVGRVFASYREDYSEVSAGTGIRNLDL